MINKKVLQTENPIPFQMIQNALQTQKVAHAYLFNGPHGSQTFEFALLTLQALVCVMPDTFACQTCQVCQRLEAGGYGDLIVLDGRTKPILKAAVLAATQQLQQTTLEVAQKKLFLILNVENTNKYALNSLLKFIEEPTKATFIVMTTHNLGAVLRTIKSRAQIVNFKPKNVARLQKELITAHVRAQYASVLATIYQNLAEALKVYDAGQFVLEYKKVRAVLEAINKTPTSGKRALVELIRKTTNYQLYLALMLAFFNDIWKFKHGLPCAFWHEKRLLKAFLTSQFDYKNALVTTRAFQVSLQFNANFDLAKERYVLALFGIENNE